MLIADFWHLRRADTATVFVCSVKEQERQAREVKIGACPTTQASARLLLCKQDHLLDVELGDVFLFLYSYMLLLTPFGWTLRILLRICKHIPGCCLV